METDGWGYILSGERRYIASKKVKAIKTKLGTVTCLNDEVQTKQSIHRQNKQKFTHINARSQ